MLQNLAKKGFFKFAPKRWSHVLFPDLTGFLFFIYTTSKAVSSYMILPWYQISLAYTCKTFFETNFKDASAATNYVLQNWFLIHFSSGFCFRLVSEKVLEERVKAPVRFRLPLLLFRHPRANLINLFTFSSSSERLSFELETGSERNEKPIVPNFIFQILPTSLARLA